MAIGNFPILIPDFMKTGVPPDPNQFVPKGDPFAELEMLLNSLQNRTFVAPPQQNLAQRILNPIAEGAAILASPDSGGALGNVLQSRQKRADDFTKLNAEIQNNLMMVKIQSAIEKARAISTEQATARQEQRQNIYDTQKAEREVKTYGKKKEIDLATAESEFRTNQKLLAEYEPAITAREKNKIIIQDWPQQRKDSVEWQAMAKTVMPNLNPEVAAVIGDKLSKLDRTPLTPEENDLVKKVNQEFAKQFQEERKAKVGKIKAETFRETQEGLYAQRDKPGAAASQDRFLNNYQSTLGRNAGDRIARFYWRNEQTGQIITDKEYNAMDILTPGVDQFKPMTPEENVKQRAIESQRFVEVNEGLQRERMLQAQPSPTPTQQKSDADVQQAIKYYQSQNYTTEQTRQALKLSGATDEQINRLMNQKPIATPSPSPSTRPRQTLQLSPEDQKMMERLQKQLEQGRKKTK